MNYLAELQEILAGLKPFCLAKCMFFWGRDAVGGFQPLPFHDQRTFPVFILHKHIHDFI